MQPSDTDRGARADSQDERRIRLRSSGRTGLFAGSGNARYERRRHRIFSCPFEVAARASYRILVSERILDPDRQVTTVIPEVSETADKGATIRQLLDMRTGVAFDEDYTASSGPIVEYRKATNWHPLGPGDCPSDLRSFYQCLRAPDGKHGGRFHYVSPNSDLLGWVIERATGQRFADLMSRYIWKPMGAQHSAYITVDRLGAPR